MSGLALLLLAQIAQPPAAAPDEIVVVGHRAEDALAACLARSCPPAEDVEASLQASVEQFAGGRYGVARKTLQAAIRRNRDHAAQLPGPVSSLYATLATVAEHEGDRELWTASARNNLLILRRHLGTANLATLTEQLTFGDTMLGIGQSHAADDAYCMVQRLALAAGHPAMAAGAVFRRALVATARGDYRTARRLADDAVALAGPGDRRLADLRAILDARIAVAKGDDGAIDALAARLRQSVDEQPRLLFSKPVFDISFVTSANPWHDSEIRFADVGYWIRPDGRTAGVEVLRDAGLGQWRSGIVKQVADRRYVPLSVAPGHPGLYRIDRFTVRATIGTPIGTRIQRRMGTLTTHIVDLTETEALSDIHKRRTAQQTTTG